MRVRTPSTWLSCASLLAVSALSGSAVSAQAAQGQKTLEELPSPGLMVWITDSAGREEKVRVVSVSGGAVVTESGDRTRHLRSAEIRRVRVRHSDSVVNGALIGAGAAVAAGLYLCNLIETWEICRNNVGPMLRIGALGAGIGIGVDALIRGRTTIYDVGGQSARFQARPLVAREAVGLSVSVGF